MLPKHDSMVNVSTVLVPFKGTSELSDSNADMFVWSTRLLKVLLGSGLISIARTTNSLQLFFIYAFSSYKSVVLFMGHRQSV